MENFKELVVILGTIILTVGTAVGGAITAVEYLTCKGFETTGVETKFSFGCYAKVGDQWVPKSQVQIKLREAK